MFTRENINKISNSIYDYLKSININVKEMYLFGSYAKGTAKEESDIDIAVFSDDFTGIRFHDFNKIKRILLKNSSVEIHTFRAEDLNSENNLFLNSVRKDFIKLI